MQIQILPLKKVLYLYKRTRGYHGYLFYSCCEEPLVVYRGCEPLHTYEDRFPLFCKIKYYACQQPIQSGCAQLIPRYTLLKTSLPIPFSRAIRSIWSQSTFPEMIFLWADINIVYTCMTPQVNPVKKTELVHTISILWNKPILDTKIISCNITDILPLYNQKKHSTQEIYKKEKHPTLI